MKKEITVAGQIINYDLKKYRRTKNLRLIINSKGLLVASKPWYASQRTLEEFIRSKIDWIKENLVKHPGDRKDEYLKHKETARELVLNRLDHFNKFYNFKYNRVSIRNSATRWGSCSSSANLNFSYRILFLDEEFRDYIVVHELCHLKEMNHSAKFWRLVELKIPNYLNIRKKLKKIV